MNNNFYSLLPRDSGQAPYGYCVAKDQIALQRTELKWELDPEIVPLVILAWQMRTQGKSYSEIIKSMMK